MDIIELLKNANTQLDGVESYVMQIDDKDFWYEYLKNGLNHHIAAMRELLDIIQRVEE